MNRADINLLSIFPMNLFGLENYEACDFLSPLLVRIRVPSRRIGTVRT